MQTTVGTQKHTFEMELKSVVLHLTLIIHNEHVVTRLNTFASLA
jgi:hypothetical protein